ncbi:MAG: efflux RND transporter permease subunit [Candidatus Latescibacterota bacterium]
MNLPEFSVNKRVTVTMMIAIVIVLGGIAFSRLGLDLLPDIEYPVVSVLTQYAGVSSEDIENLITRPVEEAVSTVNRVKSVNSFSQEGVSVVMVEFEWGTNLDFAAQDVRDGIGLIRDYLPEDAIEPLVVKFDMSMMPVMFYGVTAEGRNTLELRQLLKDVVKGRLERQEGVAAVQLMGGLEREIQVRVDKAKLEARGLSLDQVVSALRMGNLNLPAGHITQGITEFLVRSMGEYGQLSEIENTIVGIAPGAGTPIYLKNVAEVADTHQEVRSYGRTQKRDSIILMVSKQSGANTLQVGDRVKKELSEIERILPAGVRFHLFFDQSEIIRKITSRTGGNAVSGGVLAVLMIFLFLRNWRPTVTIAVAIPLSIVATFVAMYFAGYTLNLMTLAGLALGVGMLVDNAVVVIENIFRHLEEGADRITAAKEGAREVAMAITASTLTTMTVFLPMVFASGIAGKLSRGLALTISFALLSSLFVALTLVPMLASVIFKRQRPGPGQAARKRFGEGNFEGIQERYRRSLRWSLSHRKTVLGITAALFVASLGLIPIVGTEFMPSSDQPFVMLNVEMPIGTSLEETNRVVGKIEDILIAEEGVLTVGAFGGLSEASKMDVAFGSVDAGIHVGQLSARLVDKKDRTRTDEAIMDGVRAQLPDLEGIRFEFVDMGEQMMGGGGGAPVEIKLFGKDLAALREFAERIVDKIAGIEGLRDLDTSLRAGKPELRVRVDQEEAGHYGLTVGQVAAAVQTALQGKVAGQLRSGGDEFDIRVRLKEGDRTTIADIENLTVRSPLGVSVALKQVAQLEYGKGPVKIEREDQSRRVSVTANVFGRDLGSIMADIKTAVEPMRKLLPSGYFLEFGGQYAQMISTFVDLSLALLLAVLLVYMVMAALFESFTHPLVIMFTMPLALIGVILILFATGRTISLVSGMGIIMLVGIVVNNGIVLIDRVNQLRKQGVEQDEALIEAGATRLRPILITSGTTILGMIPMALSTSEGAEMRSPIALTVIGGLLTATLLTLVIIPVVYSIVDRISYKTSKRAMEMLQGEEDV